MVKQRPGSTIQTMRSVSILALALAAVGCSQPVTVTTSDITPSDMPSEPLTDPLRGPSGQPTAEAIHASADALLPGFDRAAADIIANGKFETATFALG